MKRLFIACLFVLLASVALMAAIEYDPGYILISYGLYTIESTLWVAIIAVILISISLVLIFNVSFKLLRRSFSINRWLQTRSYRRSQVKTAQGVLALVEGNWSQARRMLTFAAEKSETPLVNYLFAAHASNKLGDETETRNLLRKAEESTSGAEEAILIAQAKMQLENGHLERSLATLRRLRGSASKQPYVLKMLQSVYIGLNDWEGLAELLPELRKQGAIEKPEFKVLSIQCAKAQLMAAAAFNEGDKAIKALFNIWKAQSKLVTRNSEVVACYSQCLIDSGDQQSAEKLIRDQLNREWSQLLVDMYGVVKGSDASKQLLHAENWLKERNNDPRLFLCLGRLSLRNELWGKAKEYYETSFKLARSSDASAELGRLLSHLGEHEKSNEYFQQGLLLSTHGLPELPLPAKAAR